MFVSDPSKVLILPRGRRGLSPMTIDMSTISSVEARIPEIQRSTPLTMPELITVFNIGMADLIKIISVIEMESKEAKRCLDEAESIAMLDKVESVLASKGIKSSSDTRNAAITLDSDVMECRRSYDMLTTVSELLNNKFKVLEMAYYSAKKICEVNMSYHDSSNSGGYKE